jgi:hypothetical protein
MTLGVSHRGGLLLDKGVMVLRENEPPVGAAFITPPGFYTTCRPTAEFTDQGSRESGAGCWTESARVRRA